MNNRQIIRSFSIFICTAAMAVLTAAILPQEIQAAGSSAQIHTSAAKGLNLKRATSLSLKELCPNLASPWKTNIKQYVKKKKTPPVSMSPRTLNINGVIVSYDNSFGTGTAPASGGGLWMGSDSTTDGSYGYFIGHNPGSFSCVMKLISGNTVTVCDGDGKIKSYTVSDIFSVSRNTTWDDIAGRVTGHGECIALQTCEPGEKTYRIVVCI